MKVRIGPRSTTLTLSDGERAALAEVLGIAMSDQDESACLAKGLGQDTIAAVRKGRADFAAKVRRSLLAGEGIER